jgi:hypothetical protein
MTGWGTKKADSRRDLQNGFRLYCIQVKERRNRDALLSPAKMRDSILPVRSIELNPEALPAKQERAKRHRPNAGKRIHYEIAFVRELPNHPVANVELQGAQVHLLATLRLDHVQASHPRDVRPDVRMPALRLQEHEAGREHPLGVKVFRELHVVLEVVHPFEGMSTKELENEIMR